ncbi:MAG: hypothetical protein ACOC4J_02875 [Bacteroidota bacterium]
MKNINSIPVSYHPIKFDFRTFTSRRFYQLIVMFISMAIMTVFISNGKYLTTSFMMLNTQILNNFTETEKEINEKIPLQALSFTCIVK